MTKRILPPEHAWYLYGIAKKSDAESWLPRATVGVDGAALVATIGCGELAALVSVVPLAEFGAERVRSLAQDDVWLGRIAREHQRVVDGLQRRLTIVPARLFCVYACEDDIRASLEEGQPCFLRILERLAGCDEFEVRFTFDRALLRRDLSNSLPEIAQLVEARAAATPGRAYLLDRQIAALLQRDVDAAIDGIVGRAFAELRSRAIADRDLAPMRLTDGNSTPTVLRRVFLVKRAQRGEFLQVVERVGLQPTGTRVECSGPWPPYNFVDPDVLEEQGSIQG